VSLVRSDDLNVVGSAGIRHPQIAPHHGGISGLPGWTFAVTLCRDRRLLRTSTLGRFPGHPLDAHADTASSTPPLSTEGSARLDLPLTNRLP